MHIDVSNKYHLIGIGGDGMSGLARVLLSMGAEVVGSDIRNNEHVQNLRAAGAKVYDQGHKRSNITRDINAVIVSSAISDDNQEIQEARRLGIPIHKRLAALADLMETKTGIGVAGTHGKSTTTTMAALLLQSAGLDPTYVIGADCDQLGGNAHIGKEDYFLAEVDESDGHFLQVDPDISVVTNIERDHLDNYEGQREIIEGFKEFISDSQETLICIDDANARNLLDYASSTFTFGLRPEADLSANNIELQGFHTSFDVYLGNECIGRVRLPAPGIHNIYNSLGAMAIGHQLGLESAELLEGVQSVALPQRRFQVLRNNGAMVVDDYAHLPREIEVTLEAISNGWNSNRLIALFQPHRFSRTKHINGQFGPAFALADEVIVTQIYEAFETPIPGVTSQVVSESIRKNTDADVHRILNDEKVYDYLKGEIDDGDFLVGLGAGDVWKITQRFAE